MKNQLLILSLALSSISFAQKMNISKVSARETFTLGQEKINRSTISNKAAQINSNWYSYVNAYENYYGQSLASASANTIFPDSTVLVNYGLAGYSSPWIHGIANVFDFKAEIFENSIDPGQNFEPSLPYTIDSVNTTGRYTRVMGSAIIDTLVIRFHTSSINQLNSRGGWIAGGITTNLGSDSVIYTRLAYDSVNHKTVDPIKEIRILLDDVFAADTTDYGNHEINQFVNQAVAAGTGSSIYDGILGVTLEFRPGYTWTLNVDTLGVNLNSWRFYAWELNGDDTFPYYDKNDYNVAQLLDIDVRYNQSRENWNGLYIPMFAYMGGTAAFAYESYEINVHITQNDNIGIKENNKVDFRVYPNPSNGNVNVRFGAIENGQYSVRLVNIIGQDVYTENTTLSSGDIKSFRFEHLDKGVYLLNVSGKGLNTIQKVVLR